MAVVVIKIIILNQCEVVWNKITVVAAMLVVVKRELCRFIERVERGSDIFTDSRPNLGI